MVATFDPRSSSIAELVLAASDGSEAAYCALYERYAGRLLARLRVSFSPEFAEDAAQEAWTTAFQRLRTIQNPEAFFAWLLTIARNSARNSLRQQRWGQTVPLDWHGEAIVEEGGDPAGVAEAGESRRTARELLGRLPRRQRDALHLRWFEELSYREIARRLTLSVSAVETLIYRARSNFHRQYESVGRNETSAVLACYKIRESLAPLLVGALGDQRRRRVVAHLSRCSRCEHAFDKLKARSAGGILPATLPLGWLRTRILEWLQTLTRSGSQLATAGGVAGGAGALLATVILTEWATTPGEPPDSVSVQQSALEPVSAADPVRQMPGEAPEAAVSTVGSIPSLALLPENSPGPTESLTVFEQTTGDASQQVEAANSVASTEAAQEPGSPSSAVGQLVGGVGSTVGVVTGLVGEIAVAASDVEVLPAVEQVTDGLTGTVNAGTGGLELPLLD
jgi:RNA polymerase sigma factor (sigma-70 family)